MSERTAMLLAVAALAAIVLIPASHGDMWAVNAIGHGIAELAANPVGYLKFGLVILAVLFVLAQLSQHAARRGRR